MLTDAGSIPAASTNETNKGLPQGSPFFVGPDAVVHSSGLRTAIPPAYLQPESTRMSITLQNTIDIARDPASVYAYVTRPWRWHEWHPNSKSATARTATLQVGDSFDEVIEIRPLAPLPITLRRATRYRVNIADPDLHWQVRGETGDGWLAIDYVFAATATGTRFTRTLTFEATGASRVLMPLLRRNMVRMSALALNNLRARLEAGA